MSLLPPKLHDVLTRALGEAPRGATRLSGGDVNQAARVDTDTGSVFVKWRTDPLPGVYEAEADGLGRLARAGALRVPRVRAHEDAPGAEIGFLVLELLPVRPPDHPARFAARLGEALAALHRDNLSPDGRFGLDRDNYLGAWPQPNTPAARWTDFYRERRLLPQIEIARRRHRLPPAREQALQHVLDRLEEWLGELPSRPSLLHGDLWGGNFLACGDEPVLIDPAVYYGQREVEIAFTELFGGFPAGFLAAYDSVYPRDPGYARRRPLHQLFPLLVHLNHFGETYGPAVDRACHAMLTL